MFLYSLVTTTKRTHINLAQDASYQEKQSSSSHRKWSIVSFESQDACRCGIYECAK
jgi:hypothetical protein